MDTIIRNGHSDTIQILGEAVYISHSTDTHLNSMNPIILPPAMGK